MERKIDTEVLNALRMFGASVTHEMRTPLSTISMICRLINIELSKVDFDKERVLSYSEKISNEIRHLFSITDIIDNRLRYDTGSEQFAKFGIKNIVENVLNTYKFLDSERSLIRFDCNSDFSVFGDKILLSSVLYSFLRSALYNIRFNKKGEITIATSNEEECNILSFRDTASGIDPQVCDSIFDLVMPEKFCGSNIGLYFCKKIVESIGAEIYCESEYGEYIEFIIEFPKEV